MPINKVCDLSAFIVTYCQIMSVYLLLLAVETLAAVEWTVVVVADAVADGVDTEEAEVVVDVKLAVVADEELSNYKNMISHHD